MFPYPGELDEIENESDEDEHKFRNISFIEERKRFTDYRSNSKSPINEPEVASSAFEIAFDVN